jgi:hypothetical protein
MSSAGNRTSHYPRSITISPGSRPSPARLRGQKEAEQNQKARSLNDSRCQVLAQGDVHHPFYFSGVCK